jgi:ATP-dependent protease Clp ATPase subunit
LSVGDEIAIRVVDTSEFETSEPLTCSFCGREVHEVSTVVQGHTAAICDRCIISFSSAVKNATELPVGASIRDESTWTCGFCHNQPGDIAGVVVRNGAAVCPECLRSCAEILDERPGRDLRDDA